MGTLSAHAHGPVASLVGLAGLGGLAVASNVGSHSAHTGRGGEHDDGPEPHDNKNGGVCPNGVTRMLSHGAKKPVRLVEIKHRGVDAPCPAP